MDDDLLFDPLLSDEPIDLAAVRADDALIDALSGGGLAGADDLADDDPLIAMLAAWAASARPEPAAATHPTDPDVAAAGPSAASAAGDSGSHRRDRRCGVGRRRPPGCRDAEHRIAGRRGLGGRRAGHRIGRAGRDRRPHRAPSRPGSAHRPADRSAPSHCREPFGNAGRRRPSLAARRLADHGALGEPGDGPVGAPRRAATAAASVVTLLSRVRTAGRRTRPPGQALPPGHPLRRAAVAVVVVALGVSGAAASGGTAQPGDPAWAITKVFFAERAESIMAAQVVSAGLERAQLLLSQRQPELAKQVLAAIAASLPSVREEEGHTRLVDQQRMLEAVAALTPPLPGDPNLTSTTTPSRKTDPDPSVLAQGAPRAAGKDAAAPPAAAPPVVAKPADPATGSTGATTARRPAARPAHDRQHGTDGHDHRHGSTAPAARHRHHRQQHHRHHRQRHDRQPDGHRIHGRRPDGDTDPPATDTALAESATGPAANGTGTGRHRHRLAEADTGPAERHRSRRG